MFDRDECRSCHSRDLLEKVPLQSRGHNGAYQPLSAVVFERPEARIFKRAHRTKLHARICGRCGLVEIYADEPEALYAAHQRAAY
jgi:hypothetical protein